MQKNVTQSTIRFFLFILLLLLFSGCSEKPAGSPDTATLVGNVYDNTYFKFKIELPENWYTVDQETMKAIAKTGQDIIAGDDKNMEASLQAAEKNVYNLFQTFMVAPGTPVDFFNPSITGVAEKVSHLPGIKTGKEYLQNVKMLLNSGQINIDIDEEIQQIDLDGREFYRLNAVLLLGGKTIQQKYYTAIINRHALGFVISYAGTDQYEPLERAIEAITFY
ncbi:MAG: hypothetical protein KKE17_01280 [Proteobacteria bacterium]|nr:hypothetical protein [Pseudomonadota bacterium]MBU1708613.1 hypothetical protein [Pseudomonadota bacterium]